MSQLNLAPKYGHFDKGSLWIQNSNQQIQINHIDPSYYTAATELCPLNCSQRCSKGIKHNPYLQKITEFMKSLSYKWLPCFALYIFSCVGKFKCPHSLLDFGITWTTCAFFIVTSAHVLIVWAHIRFIYICILVKIINQCYGICASIVLDFGLDFGCASLKRWLDKELDDKRRKACVGKSRK